MFVLDGLNDEVKQRTATVVGLGRVKLAEGELDGREKGGGGDITLGRKLMSNPWMGSYVLALEFM